jgi:hypothetical protein
MTYFIDYKENFRIKRRHGEVRSTVAIQQNISSGSPRASGAREDDRGF